MAVRLVVRHPKSGAGPAEEVSFEFEQPRVVIGRSPGADVRLPDLSVSDTHATLLAQAASYGLRDEGSSNGTRVNGAPLVPGRARTLESGDEIEIGAFRLICTFGPMVRGATLPERTASLARRMLRELSPEDDASRAPPVLRVVRGRDQGLVANLPEPPARLVLGRGEEADLKLDDVDVSRLHTELVRDVDGTLARDLESKNGLVVNGKRMRERRLRHGDVLTLGETDVAYEDPAESALRGLEGQADVVVTRTNTAVAAAAGEEPAAAAASASAKPIVAAPVQPKKATSTLDLVVYGLAAFVLLASLIGLVWLFR